MAGPLRVMLKTEENKYNSDYFTNLWIFLRLARLELALPASEAGTLSD